MKTFVNENPSSVTEAVTLARAAIAEGRAVAFAGGGTDLLQLVKDRIANRPGSGAPDVVVNLKNVDGIDGVQAIARGGLRVGGLTTLADIGTQAEFRDGFAVLAEAAASVATPQIRNAGTLAGNICQRPWCWYYRNGFNCFKAGGSECFSIAGENQLHAIFGGGPSFIVHPSDLAPALVALGASFNVAGPSGERTVSSEAFFVPPREDAVRENILADDEVLVSADLPAQAMGTRGHYFKVMDREAWTHAVVSVAVVLELDGDLCRSASIVLGGVAPIPWRATAAEELLAGQRVTPELAEAAGSASTTGAQPMSKNGYKVPLTQRSVERALLTLIGRPTA